jgi:type I restriction enzyme S subunit
MISTLPFGALPNNWKIERLDRLFRVVKENARADDEPVSAFIDGVVTLRSNRPEAVIKGSGQEIGYKHLEKNDLVISGMNAHLGGLGISDSSGKCTPVYTILRKTGEIHERFISYYLWHAARSGYIKSLVNAVRYNSADFGPETVKNFMVPVPPIPEQKAIADFLDEQISILERTIDLKEKQIACLKEESKGLTLSWIPKTNSVDLGSWESSVGKNGIRAKFLFEQRKTTGVDAPLASATMEGVILRDEMANDVWNPEDASDSYKLVEPEDFVIGLRSFQHGFSYSEIRGKVSPAYTVFRLRGEFRKTFEPKYFSYLFQTRQFISLLDSISVGIRQGRNIPYEAFGDLLIPIPSTIELAKILQLQEKNLESVNLLTESLIPLSQLKVALVSSAVTGGIDAFKEGEYR